ncbi:hypothetical protein GC174_18270 [bacterium]|nr:hypothetical protein [bacterium]
MPAEEVLMRLVHPSVFELIKLSIPLTAAQASEGEGWSGISFMGDRGRIQVRNDGIRVLIEAWYKEERILMCALRDRRLDGTDASSPLTMYPNHDPACNRLPGPDSLAAELSIYSSDPATYLGGLDVEGTLGHFIADPDFYIWKDFQPEVFFPLWEQAFHINRGPWQIARPMKGVPQFFVDGAIELLRELGYHRVDAVPSWFNVAQFFKGWGFDFTNGEHELTFAGISEGLRQFEAESGESLLTRPQMAWIVALQNLPDSFVPDELKLPARWPVTHTNTYWVRMHLDLNPYMPDKESSMQNLMQERKLIKGIRALRRCSCEHETKLNLIVESRGYRPCVETLGQSSPGATSPHATD